MTTFLYILLGLAILILVLAVLAPKNYRVDRSVSINRSAKDVYEYLRFMKNHDDWSPWKKKDPNQKTTYTGDDGAEGCVMAWEGNKEVGMGEQEITKLTPNSRIDSELRFLKPFKSTSDAYFIIDDEGENQSKVTWGFSGENKFPISIMMLFMNMEKQMGPEFEKGMADLKEVMER